MAASSRLLKASFKGADDDHHEYSVCHHLHASWAECVIHSLKGAAFGLPWIVIASAAAKMRKLRGFERAIALGSLFGSFRLSSCMLMRLAELLVKNERTSWLGQFLQHYSSVLAGSLGASLFARWDSEIRSAVFVLWFSIRALRSLWPGGKLEDLVIMIFSAGGILSSYIVRPEDNAPSYQRFLWYHGAKPRKYVDLYRETEDIRHNVIPVCHLIHPNQGCWSHFVTFWFDGLIRALPLYLPVHVVGWLVSRGSLSVFVENVLRSCMFLATYCSTAWLSSCMMYRFTPGLEHVTRLNLILCNMTLPGWAVLFEQGGRRRELASYCLTHALYSYWNWFKRATGVRPRPWASILALSISFSILVQHPNSLTSYVLGIERTGKVITK